MNIIERRYELCLKFANKANDKAIKCEELGYKERAFTLYGIANKYFELAKTYEELLAIPNVVVI